jgi:hypothetical protein
MKPPPGEEGEADRLGESGLDYFTHLTVQYIQESPEARLVDVETQADRNVVWFDFDPEATPGPKASAGAVEMSVSVYPQSPAVTVGLDTRIPYQAFQGAAAWILRTCADYGVGIDLDVKEDTGETWMFLFLRVFWAGYNFEVLTAACDDLVQCRKALEARLPIEEGRERS